MRIQNKSQGFKYGDSREQPLKDLVIDFWTASCLPRYRDWYIDTEWNENYSIKFIKDNKLHESGKDHFAHTPDIAFWVWFQDQPQVKLIIEIDGESHDSKTRKISDGIFEKWIMIHYKGYVPVIRLQKRELLGPSDLVLEYLRDELHEWIQR